VADDVATPRGGEVVDGGLETAEVLMLQLHDLQVLVGVGV